MKTLNKEQTEAINLALKSALIVAGAGSGKTTVVAKRIAYLNDFHDIPIQNILAISFTNKSAKELANRVRLEIPEEIDMKGSWISTFHSMANRIINENSGSDKFTIISESQQNKLIEESLATLGFNNELTANELKEYASFINLCKANKQRASDIPNDNSSPSNKAIYTAYERLCKERNLADFAELLYKAYEILSTNPKVLNKYRDKFKYVLVDEFQDIDSLQYALIRLLTEGKDNLFVVGDDDQTIYSFRGSCSNAMSTFISNHPDCSQIKLIHNYRSSTVIVGASNAVIANNNERMDKELISNSPGGELISINNFKDDIKEADYIAKSVEKLMDGGVMPSDIAVIYRNNNIAANVKKAFTSASIDYEVVKKSFFQSLEIKHAFAYAELAINHSDEAFKRICNAPTRGLSKQLVAKLEHDDRSLWDSALLMAINGELKKRQAESLSKFIALINKIEMLIRNKSASMAFMIITCESGLNDLFVNEQQRLDNLNQLTVRCQSFFKDNAPIGEESELECFIRNAEALEEKENNNNCVQLMTIHAAKGLEFNSVFLPGVEQGVLPHYLSKEQSEERRLFYVAMTRAKHHLFITHTAKRGDYGCSESTFIREIPAELITTEFPANITESVLVDNSKDDARLRKIREVNTLEIKDFLGCVIYKYRCRGNTFAKTVKMAIKNGIRMSYCNFNSCDLQFADFNNADISYSTFDKSNLRFANFTNANTKGVKFDDAILSSTRIDYADISNSVII